MNPGTESKSKMFTESIETPMYAIIEDLGIECKTTFLGIERIETEDNLLEKIYAKQGDKMSYPVCSYLISDAKIDQEAYTDSQKKVGEPLVNYYGKPVLNSLNKGLKTRCIPIVITVDLFATFDNYVDAWSFLLDTLWIDRKKALHIKYDMKGFDVSSDIYYKLDDDFNTPEPVTKPYALGSFTARLSIEVQTALFRYNTTKPAITNIRMTTS